MVYKTSNGIVLSLFGIISLAGLPTAILGQVFTNSADFDAASGLVVIEDFESSALGQLPAGSSDIGLFDIFLGTEDSDDTTRIVDSGLVNGSREFQGDLDNDSNATIRFDFDQDVFGFGADFNEALSGDRLTLEINNTIYQLSDFLPGTGTGFFGVITEDSFDSVTFGRENPSVSGKFFAIDDVRLSSVPEPGTGLVFLSITFLVGARRRR